MPSGIYERKTTDPAERFWPKVKLSVDGCLLWQGATDSHGYGQIKIAGKHVPAHRFAYEYINGAIPNGLELDHLCRTHNCVNPAHLEAVTHQINAARGETGNNTGIIQLLKTHCPQGHEYTESNTYMYRGRRNCRECHRIREAGRRKMGGI